MKYYSCLTTFNIIPETVPYQTSWVTHFFWGGNGGIKHPKADDLKFTNMSISFLSVKFSDI